MFDKECYAICIIMDQIITLTYRARFGKWKSKKSYKYSSTTKKRLPFLNFWNNCGKNHNGHVLLLDASNNSCLCDSLQKTANVSDHQTNSSIQSPFHYKIVLLYKPPLKPPTNSCFLCR